ncbi:hypothetical protein AO286_26235 [Pseudomonas syringae]|uniref:hypothetical protein n=1 Tax=Pseudomonas syringae TaxID=317 RepID=UPI000C075804|nr:hypothetical protein [Pseudomonas syringae]PHN71056.1 hypothetical protein AO286_26235 [Pseudomonas syringae]
MMLNIYINDVLVGSLSEYEIDQLKTLAMKNRARLQFTNIMYSLAKMSLVTLKLTPFIIAIMLTAVVNHNVMRLQEVFQLFAHMAIPSFMIGFSAVMASMFLFGCRFGYKNVAKEEFYRLLRVKLGVAATGIITQSEAKFDIGSAVQ